MSTTKRQAPASARRKQPTPSQGHSENGGESPPASTEPKTFFYVLTVDANLNRLTPLKHEDDVPPTQDPCDARARYIDVHLDRRAAHAAKPPRDQLDFAAAVEKLPHVLNHVYQTRSAGQEVRFRHFYVEVFRLANLVLQEGLLTADEGVTLLKTIEDDLVKAEGVRVKNKRLGDLVRTAGGLSIPLVIAYFALSRVDPASHPTAYSYLTRLHIDPPTLASFILVWLGCFVGVCLSFGLRKPKLTVDDLVATTEPDFFRPMARLAFAGTLTMVLVMFATLKLINIQVADLELAKAVSPGFELLAFALGVICGISEWLLPARILTETNTLLPGAQPAR